MMGKLAFGKDFGNRNKEIQEGRTADRGVENWEHSFFYESSPEFRKWYAAKNERTKTTTKKTSLATSIGTYVSLERKGCNSTKTNTIQNLIS